MRILPHLVWHAVSRTFVSLLRTNPEERTRSASQGHTMPDLEHAHTQELFFGYNPNRKKNVC